MGKRSPEETAAELRELIRDANGTIGELSRLLREVRSLIATAAQTLNTECETLVNRLLLEAAEKTQVEMNQHAADLNAAVDEARLFVVKQLIPVDVTQVDGKLRVRWRAQKFDEDGEVTKR